MTPEQRRTADDLCDCRWPRSSSACVTLHRCDAVNHDAAWYYPEPLPAAAKIKGYIAFWKGVKVEA
jgi:uncharacterized protein (DUF427 family)